MNPAWPPPQLSPAIGPIPPPGGRRRLGAALVAGLVALALIGFGVLGAWPLLPASAPSPGATGPVPPITTRDAVAVPATVVTLETGADLRRPFAFTTGSGAGVVRIDAVTWTNAGQAAPPAGERHLLVRVGLDCTAGRVSTDPMFFVAEADRALRLPGFGPGLADPLSARTLTAGQRVAGEIGFTLPAGRVRISLLDQDLRTVATIQVPGP